MEQELINKEEEILKELNLNSGTQHYFKIPFSKVVYTDGINDLINKCGCWWLISDTGIYLNSLKEYPNFLILTIKVNKDKTALITLKEDTDIKPIYKKELTYTDFPIKEYEFYIIDEVMLLKGEY